MTLRDEISGRSGALLESLLEALPPFAESANFVTERFVRGLSTSPISDEQARIMEVLAKKIEVGRTLCRVYADDLRKAIDATAPAPASIVALAAAFFHHGLIREDWKWINTVLKLEGGILKKPEFEAPDKLASLVSELLDERK